MDIHSQRQNGAAILLFMSIIFLAAASLLVAELSVNERRQLRQATSLDTLGQAKQALIGFALENAIPGTLPCPDTTGDGVENPNGGGCAALLGLLPHRTLNLPRAIDGSGAELWYAVDTNYTANAAALKNSSITTVLSLDGNVSAAVVLAPGAPLNGQARRALNQSDHLEGLNADSDFTVFESTQTENQNDKVVSIEPGRFWSTVEQRILVTTENLLIDYRTQCGEFPWAAPFGGPFISVNSQQFGALPLTNASPTDWGNACGFGTAPTPATWLVNHWPNQILYRMCQTAEGNCVAVLNSATSPSAGVIIGPGIALNAQIRPDTDTADYFEDENTNLPDDQFRRTIQLNHSNTYNDTTQTLNP